MYEDLLFTLSEWLSGNYIIINICNIIIKYNLWIVVLLVNTIRKEKNEMRNIYRFLEDELNCNFKTKLLTHNNIIIQVPTLDRFINSSVLYCNMHDITINSVQIKWLIYLVILERLKCIGNVIKNYKSFIR